MLPQKACERCVGLLLPKEGSHYGEQATQVSQAIAAHDRLIRRAWRSSYPQEGAEHLYQCDECRSWWGHVVWARVPEEDLVRHDVGAVAAWVAQQPFGEVVS
jgi:hypothetical protein